MRDYDLFHLRGKAKQSDKDYLTFSLQVVRVPALDNFVLIAKTGDFNERPHFNPNWSVYEFVSHDFMPELTL